MRKFQTKILGLTITVIIGASNMPPIICVGKRVFFFSMPAKVAKFFGLARGLLPRWYAVGARCCDHGGQVRSWHPVALTDRQAAKWQDAGDGPDVFHELSVFEFIKWRVRLKLEKRYCDRVE